jgi:nicotinamide-nucleotide amidase
VIDKKLLNKISEQLKARHLTVATAESCTGGLLAHILTNISGSSDYFHRGIIAYSNQAKIDLLNVSKQSLRDHGAVSSQIAEAMAIGIRIHSHVDIGISTTGIAGPTGGTKDKPVGLVFIGFATSNQVKVEKFIFSGTRLHNKESTCNAALQMLNNLIS